jgi:hypothetical protein
MENKWREIRQAPLRQLLPVPEIPDLKMLTDQASVQGRTPPAHPAAPRALGASDRMGARAMITRILIVCCVPETAPVVTAVRQAFESKCRVYGYTPTVDVFARRDRGACMAALGTVADHLVLPNAKAIVYYYGHGDQARNRSCDEADGVDEVWSTWGSADDELSALFSHIHDSSRLYMFSDSCSSGSMLDTTNRRPWVAIGSARNSQDSLATSDGEFTLLGLIPALRIDTNPTPRKLVERIHAALDIDTQTCTLTAGNTRVVNEPMF